MSIFGLPLSMFQVPEVIDDDMASQICLPYFNNSIKESGQSCISVNDVDTVKQLVHDSAISNGSPQSIHESDDSTSYQNLSGNDAMLIMVPEVVNNTGISMAFKLWDAPTDNSIAGATLRYENAGGIANLMNAAGQRGTLPPIKISNNNYCVLEIISVVGNTLRVTDGLCWVVERG